MFEHKKTKSKLPEQKYELRKEAEWSIDVDKDHLSNIKLVDENTLVISSQSYTLQFRAIKDGSIIKETKLDHPSYSTYVIGDAILSSTVPAISCFDIETLKKKSELPDHFGLGEAAQLSPTELVCPHFKRPPGVTIIDVSDTNNIRCSSTYVQPSQRAIYKLVVVPTEDKESPLIVMAENKNQITCCRRMEFVSPEKHKKVWQRDDVECISSLTGMINGHLAICYSTSLQMGSLSVINIQTGKEIPIATSGDDGLTFSALYGAGFAFIHSLQPKSVHYWDLATQESEEVPFDKTADKCFIQGDRVITLSGNKINVYRQIIHPELINYLQETFTGLLSKDPAQIAIDYTGGQFEMKRR